MSETEIKVPNIGDFKNVEVIEVLVSEGQTINKNDPLITIESDKSSVEIPSNFNGKIRKLSSIINLSKPGDYEGGNLEFDFRNLSEKSSNIRVCNEIKEQGSIVIFPSFIYHRVTPITKGTRHSLVSWTVGYPWK